jgi:hypothetical protein
MELSGLVAASDGQFVAGLLIGVFLGLLLGPILRSWLAWREWVEASREAELAERFLARLEAEAPSLDETSGNEGQAEECRPSPRGPSGAPRASRPDPA